VLWSVRDQALVDRIGPDLFEAAGLRSDLEESLPLQRRSNSKVNIHFTGASSPEPRVNDELAGLNQAMGKNCGTLLGRPDLDAYFRGMIEEELNKLTTLATSTETATSEQKPPSNRVAVVVCGPDELISRIALLCKDHSFTAFDLHIESFSM
jgi:ferredoxin-NADP reductase